MRRLDLIYIREDKVVQRKQNNFFKSFNLKLWQV